MKVVFFGTPQFSADLLAFLLEKKIDIVAVVSKPDRPQGRSKTPVPTAVKKFLLDRFPSIPLFQPEVVSTPDFAAILGAYEPDFFVVAAYGEIIKSFLLEVPKKAALNLHTSLLPRLRGAAPIQRAIMSGETKTGVTVIHMVKKMDAGEMLKKVEVPIEKETTFGDLERALSLAGNEAIFDTLMHFEEYDKNKQIQDETAVTFAPKIELEDCEISWKEEALVIHNLVRGVNPYPGAWCYVKVKGELKRLKIFRTKVTGVALDLPPGAIANLDSPKENLIIACGKAHGLELLEVQLEGKKLLSSAELTRGIPRSFFEFF